MVEVEGKRNVLEQHFVFRGGKLKKRIHICMACHSESPLYIFIHIHKIKNGYCLYPQYNKLSFESTHRFLLISFQFLLPFIILQLNVTADIRITASKNCSIRTEESRNAVCSSIPVKCFRLTVCREKIIIFIC